MDICPTPFVLGLFSKSVRGSWRGRRSRRVADPALPAVGEQGILAAMDPAASSPAVVGDVVAADPAATRAAGLLDRFARGDEAAFTELVAEYQPVALMVAARVVGSRSDVVEDVVQEAFMRVLRHQGRFDPARPFRAWLLAIVRNLAIDALRRRRPQAGPEAAAQLEDQGGAAGGALDGAELRQRVAEILSGLPEKYRDLLVMREMEDRPAETIAQELGLDYGTTRWRLHQARTLFRAAWTKRFGEAP
jgi:RNA polymerase sigma-70 factor (ECF subfamily)